MQYTLYTTYTISAVHYTLHTKEHYAGRYVVSYRLLRTTLDDSP